MTGCVIVITGNPGTGKHTIAKKLSEETGCPMLDLNKMAIEAKIFEKHGSTLDVDVGKLARLVKKMAQKDSIIVGHLAPYVVSRSQVKFAIVLRKNPYKLIPIYKKRNYTKKKIIENVGSEILGIISYDMTSSVGKAKVRQVDASGSINDTMRRVRSALKRPKSDRVDWLGLVAKRGDLERFFPAK